jgi:hypothetical protein
MDDKSKTSLKDLGDCFVSAGARDSSGNPFGRILDHYRIQKNMTWHELSVKTGVPPVKLMAFAKSFSKENLNDSDKEAVKNIIDYFENHDLKGKKECLQVMSGLSQPGVCNVPSDLVTQYDEDLEEKGPRSAAKNLFASLEKLDSCCPN